MEVLSGSRRFTSAGIQADSPDGNRNSEKGEVFGLVILFPVFAFIQEIFIVAQDDLSFSNQPCPRQQKIALAFAGAIHDLF
jgi:hypothetical protein